MKLKMKTIEDYVELVYNIQKKKKRVQTNDVAFALNINPASVTEIFQKLSNEGYIDYEKYSGVKLTGKGKKIGYKKNVSTRYFGLTNSRITDILLLQI